MAEIKVDMKAVKEIVRGLGLEQKGKAQKWLDAQLAAGMEQYVPFKEGVLAGSVHKSRFGSGRLIYDTPYAKRQYYAGRKPHTDPNRPLAGVKWAERYWKEHKREVCRRLQDYIKQIT